MIDADHMGRIAARMKITANRWPWDGVGDERGMALLQRLRELDGETGASLMFSLEHGYHTSGWWKNPDYERCYHLSIASLAKIFDSQPSAYHKAQAGNIPELTTAALEAWARAFFGDKTRLIWIEPPYTGTGKALDTWHYRLFVDENGIPILPQGEVYSRELTEAGWKSWSEVHQEARNGSDTHG